MSLIPWTNKGKGVSRESDDPFSISRFREEMEHAFDRFFRNPWNVAEDLFTRASGWAPALDISEDDHEVTVRAEVPGVDPEDLDIGVSGNVLTVSGEKKESKEEKAEGYAYSERRFGSFRRSIQLPASVDPDKISAEYDKGVLMIRLAKSESARPKRIPVRVAGE